MQPSSGSSNDLQSVAPDVLKHLDSALAVLDPQQRFWAINPAFERLLGHSIAALQGQLVNGFVQPWANGQSLTQLQQHVGKVSASHSSGQTMPLWARTTVIDAGEHAGFSILTLTPLNDTPDCEQTAWQAANFDALTQLPNRGMWTDRLHQEIKKNERAQKSLAVLLLDLDHFKEINDSFNHALGDSLLAMCAQRLQACVRKSDTVARLGGDEFSILLSDIDDPAHVDKVAQNILSALSTPFELGGEVLYVSASMGITLYPADASDADDLIRNADQALHAAKKSGRARYTYFTSHMQEAALNRMRLGNDLRTAIAQQQFSLHYQPIVNLTNGHITKAEALLRWEHPSRGPISPMEFIPVAEQTGLILPIGDWVFREAARQAAAWNSQLGHAVQISVNTSAAQYRKQGISQTDWFDYLHALGLPRSHIVIEITESMMMEETQDVTTKLSGLREGGLQVSLDDFGTGYSSLSYIKKFNIDYIKIDRSFIRNLHADSDDLALCEAIIVMAHKLGMAVIAEGIETEEQAKLLMTAGCDFGQGYWFSKPVPAPQFEKLLTQGQFSIPA